MFSVQERRPDYVYADVIVYTLTFMETPDDCAKSQHKSYCNNFKMSNIT